MGLSLFLWEEWVHRKLGLCKGRKACLPISVTSVSPQSILCEQKYNLGEVAVSSHLIQNPKLSSLLVETPSVRDMISSPPSAFYSEPHSFLTIPFPSQLGENEPKSPLSETIHIAWTQFTFTFHISSRKPSSERGQRVSVFSSVGLEVSPLQLWWENSQKALETTKLHGFL